MDTEGFLAFIAPNAEFRFGSAAPLRGHAGIRTVVKDVFASFASLACRRGLLQAGLAPGCNVHTGLIRKPTFGKPQ